MSYRRRSSPLHAVRAGVASAWCLVLSAVALTVANPVVLGGLVVAILAAGATARVGPELRRAALWGIPLVIAIVLINMLVSRNGLTVIARLGTYPVLGETDVTLEATVYGAVLGLQAMVLILCGALYTAAVDPDQVLALFRRVSFRSALSATIATRMVPVLVRDARHLADAQRCRPGPPPSRLALMRATTSGVLDRALDVAAALEVRGYGAARHPARRHKPYSRHDLAFAASVIAIVATVIVVRLAALAPFRAYPSLSAPAGASELAVASMLLVVVLLPFSDRRGIER